MRDSHGPSVSKVAAGISLDRIEFSTLRIAERGMRKSSSCAAMSCVATTACQYLTLQRAAWRALVSALALHKVRQPRNARKRPLTNASPSLRMSKVFKFDLGTDLGSRLLKPCEERLTSAVKVRHVWQGKERLV